MTRNRLQFKIKQYLVDIYMKLKKKSFGTFIFSYLESL